MTPAIRLIQADDLDAWQRVLLLLGLPAIESTGTHESKTQDVALVEPPVIVVPSRAAAEQWRRTLEQRLLADQWAPPGALQDALEHHVGTGPRGALAVPRLLTREDLYDVFHGQARVDTPRLAPVTREVVMGASARHAARVRRPPFLLRPGLVAEMLRFHDQLERLGHEPSAWLREAAAGCGRHAWRWRP